ncbi:MAG: hypothetical protein CMJ32_10675 [Phycisphaerae bacterium]|nr:hypothetical protein [Phycisphaerae bacterium]
MSDRVEQTWEKYRGLSPVYQGSIAVLAVMVLFLLADEYLWAVARQWNQSADRYAEILHEGASKEAEFSPRMEATIRAVGPVNIPSTEADGAKKLSRTINSILKDHKIYNDSYDNFGGAKLPSDALTSITSSTGGRIEKVTGRLQFDASPEEALKIISEIESNPEIESISSLRITRMERMTRVTVKMTVEAWIMSPLNAGRRG